MRRRGRRFESLPPLGTPFRPRSWRPPWTSTSSVTPKTSRSVSSSRAKLFSLVMLRPPPISSMRTWTPFVVLLARPRLLLPKVQARDLVPSKRTRRPVVPLLPLGVSEGNQESREDYVALLEAEGVSLAI